MEPMEVLLEPLVVAGISIRAGLDEESTTRKIPALWERFRNEDVPAQIASRTDDQFVFGVYSGYDADGTYTLTAGVRVADTKELDPALSIIDIPAGRYLLFPSARGPLHEVLPKVWQDACAFVDQHPEWKRAASIDIESYDIRKMKDGEGEAKLYLAVEKAAG